MKMKLCAAATAAAGFAALGGTASAQGPYYPICPSGQINSATSPYYCIPDGSGGGGGGGGGKRKIKKVTVAVKPKVDKKAPYAYKVSGKVTAGAAASSSTVKAQASAASLKGKITFTVKRGKKTVASKTAKVSKSGRFATKVKIKAKKLKGRKGKLKIKSAYKGNGTFKKKTGPTRTVRYVK